jgi:hypothetical protein
VAIGEDSDSASRCFEFSRPKKISSASPSSIPPRMSWAMGSREQEAAGLALADSAV